MNNSTNSSRADPTFYLTTQLATGIVLTILSPVTVISNALLLFTIFKDPLKCFRTPPTYFIVALALVDLITGIFIEPFFIMARLVRYITWTIRLVNEPYKSLWFFGGMFSYVGLNASFLLVLGLIVSQFIAITYPHRYRVIVTTRRVLHPFVRVLHRVHFITVRGCSTDDSVKRGSPPSFNTHHGSTNIKLVAVIDIVSQI